jgi:hypothetical protein
MKPAPFAKPTPSWLAMIRNPDGNQNQRINIMSIRADLEKSLSALHSTLNKLESDIRSLEALVELHFNPPHPRGTSENRASAAEARIDKEISKLVIK